MSVDRYGQTHCDRCNQPIFGRHVRLILDMDGPTERDVSELCGKKCLRAALESEEVMAEARGAMLDSVIRNFASGKVTTISLCSPEVHAKWPFPDATLVTVRILAMKEEPCLPST